MESLEKRHNQYLELNDKEIELGKIIYQVNLLVAYPLSDIQITDWAKAINRMRPELDLKDLQIVIDRMISGGIEYNTNKGIQNLFTGLNRLKQEQIAGEKPLGNSQYIGMG